MTTSYVKKKKQLHLPSKRRVVSEGLDTHGLAGGQQHDGGVPGLDELGVVLGGLAGTTVNLLLDLSELKKTSLVTRTLNSQL